VSTLRQYFNAPYNGALSSFIFLAGFRKGKCNPHNLHFEGGEVLRKRTPSGKYFAVLIMTVVTLAVFGNCLHGLEFGFWQKSKRPLRYF